MTREQQFSMIQDAVAKLREHFETVQILVSFVEDDGGSGTVDMFCGSGNWYARQGMAREFITRDQAMVSAVEISDALKGEDPT